jgi:hypothetical protein
LEVWWGQSPPSPSRQTLVASLKHGILEYRGTYQDHIGIEEVIIKNDFNDISFKLGNFNFVGNYFDDFELEGYENFTPEQLNRFTLKPIDIYESDKKRYELKNYILSFSFPVDILNLETKQTSSSNLFIKLDINSVDNDTRIFLKIVYNDQEYSGISVVFEGAADQTNKQINGKFIIKNCYWCLYSDYSVYGQGLVGPMFCFLKYKDQYLKVRNKGEYMELPDDIPLVQEIYSCDSFAPRKPGTGYRG